MTILLEDQDGAIITEDFAVGSSDNAGVILLESTVIEINGGSVQREDMDGRIITENIQIQTDGTTRIINEREDLFEAKEVFCTGTAVQVTPVGRITYKNDVYKYNDGNLGPITKKIKKTLTKIQRGEMIDPFGWLSSVSI